MRILTTLVSALKAPFDGEALERELDDELASYLELLIDEKLQSGMDPEEARREALAELGGAEQVKATVRETRHGAFLDTLMHDLRFAARLLRKSPGFTAIVILTLAIGIGANTALFSTIKALLLSSLPYEDPDRLVATTKTYEGVSRGPVSRLDAFDYRDLSRSFEGFGMISGGQRLTLTGGDRAEAVSASFVSWDLLQILGVHPVVGRHFSEAEEEESGANRLMISSALWQEKFAGSSDAIGASLTLNGEPFEIVGVLPAGFRFWSDDHLWILIDRDCPIDAQRDSHSMWAIGRLKEGVALADAQREVDSVAERLAEEYPDTNTGKGLMLWDLREFMVAHVRPSLNLLIITTALVLLIACANVTGLMLARGRSRIHEIAMRSALGAGRGRLVRQLTTESFLLTMAAGIVGIGVAVVFHRLLLRLLPPGDPGVPVPTIDGGVLLFAVAISAVTGVVVGILPALRVTSSAIWSQLGSSGRTTENRQSTRLRTALVVGQVAMSVTLLIGCGLLILSMVRLAGTDLGFNPENLTGGRVSILETDFPSAGAGADFFSQLIDAIEAVPGVRRAAAVTKMPFAARGTDWPIWHATEPRPEPRDYHLAYARFATPGYFDTMEIPLLRGRDISDSDREDSSLVLVVSEATARGMFGDSNPIGRMVKLGWTDDVYEIIGVVGNARLNSVRYDSEWAIYMASAQFPVTFQWLVVRTDGDPERLAGQIQALAEDSHRNAIVSEFRSLRSYIDDDLEGFRVVMLALGILAAVALLLTAIGLYGVLAFHVGQRTPEIGIRYVLGASTPDVVLLILRKGVLMVGAGLVVGLLGATMMTRFIRNLLYETANLEPSALVGAGIFLAAVSLVACCVPAWRAGHIKPMEALRRD